MLPPHAFDNAALRTFASVALVALTFTACTAGASARNLPEVQPEPGDDLGLGAGSRRHGQVAHDFRRQSAGGGGRAGDAARGGSAADAAIAVQLVLNLVEPQSSGLGGGAFVLHWDAAGKQLKSYDGRETAPAAAKPDRFLVDDRP